MRNIFEKFITILACLVAVSAFSFDANACTTPGLSGSIGDSTANPPDSWITAISANGTGTLQVTYYNPSTSTSTTKPFIVDSTNGITVTGGWTGSPTAHVTSITLSGAQITFNGGPSKLTFVGATWQTATFNWGTGGGMTQMVSNNAYSLSIQGWVVSGSHYAGLTSSFTGTCPLPGNFTKVAANDCASMAIGLGGVVYYWGYEMGSFETTGQGLSTAQMVAWPSTQIVGATALATGLNHACALLHGGTSGTVQCWGRNAEGQLGDGTYTSRMNPAPVPGLTGVIFIAAGEDHTCAVLSSGAVKCWGNNNMGQLGTGTSGGTFNTPQAVPSITSGAHTIGAGFGNTVAMVNGRAYTWGDNEYGQSGLGGAVDSNPHPTPAQITSLGTTVNLVSSNTVGTVCSTSNSGAMTCWGFNGSGGVGNGTSGNNITSPALVSGGLGFSNIIPPYTGDAHTCGVTGNGAAYCWGFNGDGELGNGNNTNTSTPVGVSGQSSGVNWAAAGDFHSCFVTNGHVYCTGDNQCGELGNGTSTNSNTPVLVLGS